MKVAAIMTDDVVVCGAHDTLERAAHLMWDRDVGCLPVVDAVGGLLGIVTDRDVALTAYRRGLPLREIPVSMAMAPRVYVCAPDDEVGVAAHTMSVRRVRRLPVVDDAGHVVGVVSLDDLPTSSVGTTLAAVIGAEAEAEG